MNTRNGIDTLETERGPLPSPMSPAHLRSEEQSAWMGSVSPRSIRGEGVDGGTTWTPTGKLVNLRFLRAAFRRLRWLWLLTAVVGLGIGAGYHLMIPLKYTATTALTLSQGGGKQTHGNDLAMLQSTAVTQRADALLGNKHLSTTSLLGKRTASFVGSNTLEITVSARTAKEAVRRVSALARAFLAFRAQTYAAQYRAVLNSDRTEVTKLQQQMAVLSTEISHAEGKTPAKKTSSATSSAKKTSAPKTTAPKTSAQLAALKSQRAFDTSQIITLETQMAATTLKASTSGSRVLSPATVQAPHNHKVMAVDGLSGLAGGLGAGLLLTGVIAIVSDRPRTREDVASLLGAPVGLSLGRIGGRWTKWRSPWKLAAHPTRELSALAAYLGDRVSRGAHVSGELVVAIDDETVAAAALLVLASDLAVSGKEPLLIDATESRELGRAVGISGTGSRSLDAATGPSLRVVVPPRPWENGGDDDAYESQVGLDGATTILVLATVNPTIGAQHLRHWGSEAVVILAAGRSSAQRIGTTEELLSAADIAIASAVLLDTDPRDESAGQPLKRSTSEDW